MVRSGAATIDEGYLHRQQVWNQRETAGALFKMPKLTLRRAPRAGRRHAGLSLALACEPCPHHGQHRHHDDRFRPRRFSRRL